MPVAAEGQIAAIAPVEQAVLFFAAI